MRDRPLNDQPETGPGRVLYDDVADTSRLLRYWTVPNAEWYVNIVQVFADRADHGPPDIEMVWTTGDGRVPPSVCRTPRRLVQRVVGHGRSGVSMVGWQGSRVA